MFFNFNKKEAVKLYSDNIFITIIFGSPVFH